jgi:hypothetical protein
MGSAPDTNDDDVAYQPLLLNCPAGGAADRVWLSASAGRERRCPAWPAAPPDHAPTAQALG